MDASNQEPHQQLLEAWCGMCNNIKQGSCLPVLSKPAVEAASMQASATIPAALRVMLDFEKYFGMQHAPAGMEGGQCRVTLSMNLWVNLANSTHYDGNNVSQGFSIWMAPLMIGIQFFLK